MPQFKSGWRLQKGHQRLAGVLFGFHRLSRPLPFGHDVLEHPQCPLAHPSIPHRGDKQKSSVNPPLNSKGWASCKPSPYCFSSHSWWGTPLWGYSYPCYDDTHLYTHLTGICQEKPVAFPTVPDPEVPSLSHAPLPETLPPLRSVRHPAQVAAAEVGGSCTSDISSWPITVSISSSFSHSAWVNRFLMRCMTTCR